MTPEAGKIYVFEEFRLEPETRMLIRRADGNGGEGQIRLSNRPFQVLLYLIENRDRIVTRGELLEKFRDGREVYDEAVTKCVGAIRKALDEPPKQTQPRFIETRWAGGYRFVGNVEEAQPRSYLEIEKSREVKIFIEADLSEPPAAAGGLTQRIKNVNGDSSKNSSVSNAQLQSSAPAGSSDLRRRFSKSAVILVFCVALTLAVSGFIFFRNSFRQNPGVPPNSIAVLPLKNLSDNHESEIFGDGMTESLISSLSKIEGLKVISRNSSFAFKNRDAAPQEIAERLGVKTFIEGSVREGGGRIRVEVRLVNAESGEILWSGDAYDRALRSDSRFTDLLRRVGLEK